MWRFVLVSLIFLGWAFYEISGGDAYRPAPGSLQARATRDAAEPVPDAATRPGPLSDRRRAGLAMAETGDGLPRRAVRPLEVVLRLGPGKGYGRVARLERHDEVDLLRAPGGGWVRVRVAETGQAGWMPEGLLYRVP